MDKSFNKYFKKNLFKVLSTTLAILMITQCPMYAIQNNQASTQAQQQKPGIGKKVVNAIKAVVKHPLTPIVTVSAIYWVASYRRYTHWRANRIMNNNIINDRPQEHNIINDDSIISNFEINYIDTIRHNLININPSLANLISRVNGYPEIRNRLVNIITHNATNLIPLAARYHHMRSQEIINEINTAILQLIADIRETLEFIPDLPQETNDINNRLNELEDLINNYNHEFNQEDDVQEEDNDDDNPQSVDVIIHNLRRTRFCKLSQNGKRIYVKDFITSQNVPESESVYANELGELCRKYESVGVSDGNGGDSLGWERTPYEYFFLDHQYTYTHMYNSLSIGHKKLFKQVIKVMYDNKDKEEWATAIQNAMFTLRCHGGHCSWRAASIVHNAHDALFNDSPNNKGNNNPVTIDRMFSKLKDRLAAKAGELYIQNNRNNNEPLNIANALVDTMQLKLGVTDQLNYQGLNIQNNRAYSNLILQYFNMIMNKKSIMDLSDEFLNYTFGDSIYDTPFFKTADETEMSFNEYCNITGKTDENIELMETAINNDTDVELKEWITNNDCKMAIGGDEGIISRLLSLDSADKGCPEIDTPFGFKFLIMLYKNGYLEDNRSYH